MAISWLRRLHDEKKEVSRFGLIPAHSNFMIFGNENDKEAGLPKIWLINGEKNIKWLDENKDKVLGSVHTSMPSCEGKAVIFVGLGPSINRQWESLKNLDDRFIIVATNSSAEFLVKKDIIPDYVIAIDGRPGNWNLNLGDRCKDIVGIFSVCVAPDALTQWPGKIMIVPYGVDDKSLNRKIRRRFGKPMMSGGNAINNAAAIFFQCTKSKIFFFVGHDLSFVENYYADRESKNDESVYFYATDTNGQKVRTLIPLYEYKIWLENLMVQLYPEYHFFNCSDGILGVDVDGALLPFVTQLPLKDAIEATQDAFKVGDSTLDEKLKYIYDFFYDHDLGNLQRGVGVWKFIAEYYGDFKTGLDVGCGRANGVQWAREKGYDVHGCDVSSGAVKCWEERGVVDFCRVAPANDLPYEDGQFDVVLCSEVMEHIPEYDTMDSLKEIFRVGRDKYVFTIALIPESIPIAGYIQTHINLHSPEWWLEQFGKAGFNVVAASYTVKMGGMSILAVKDLGAYQRGEKRLPKDKEGYPFLAVIGVADEAGVCGPHASWGEPI